MIKRICISIIVVASVAFMSLFFQSYTKTQKLEQKIELQKLTIEEMNKKVDAIDESTEDRESRLKVVESKVKSLEKKNALLKKENESLEKKIDKIN